MKRLFFRNVFFILLALFSPRFLSADSNVVESEQYFLVMYGYQDGRNSIPASHTFASYIRAPKGSNLSTGQGLEFHDISWLPADFASRLRVDLRLRPEPGRNYSLKETLDFVRTKNQLLKNQRRLNEISKTTALSLGAYPISKGVFDAGLGRIDELNSGKMFYIVDDIRHRAATGDLKSAVVNCIHAVSDAFGKPFTGTEHGLQASENVQRFFNDSKLINTDAGKNIVLSNYIDKMLQDRTAINEDGPTDPHVVPAPPQPPILFPGLGHGGGIFRRRP